MVSSLAYIYLVFVLGNTNIQEAKALAYKRQKGDKKLSSSHYFWKSFALVSMEAFLDHEIQNSPPYYIDTTY